MGDIVKSREWLKETIATLGGSSLAAAIGESEWETPQQRNGTMRDCIHRDILPAPIDNDAVRGGTLYEPLAREEFERNINQKVEVPPIIYRDDLPAFHYRADGLFSGGGLKHLVEIKAPMPGGLQKIRLQGIPSQYLIQGTLGMVMTGADQCSYLFWDRIRAKIAIVVTVAFDEAAWLGIRELGERFMVKVLADEPWDETQQKESACVRFDEDGEVPVGVATLSRLDAIEAARAYWESKELADECVEMKEAAQKRLIEMIPEGRAGGEVPGLIRFYSREQAGRVTFDKARAIKKYPALLGEEFNKRGEPFTQFRAYRIKT